jgi:hypothetical protein
MKIIFLDIDGVLNVISQSHDDYGAIFHNHFMDNLKELINKTGAKIVISSSWRKSGLKEMQDLWTTRNLAGEVIDVTPSLYLQKGGSICFWNDKLQRQPTEKVHGYSIPRGCEIEYWLKNEAEKFGDIESYVILDDDTDMLLNQMDNFVQCSNNQHHEDCVDIGYGLTKLCTEKAINILNNINTEELVFNTCSVRLRNCLLRARFSNKLTFSQLSKTPSYELLKHRNFGKRSIVEIKEYMKERNIDWV